VSPPKQALDVVLLTNSLFAVPINDKLILVAHDNLQNRNRLEPTTLRTFQLKNIDAHQLQMIQTGLALFFQNRATAVPNPETRTLTVRTTLENMKKIEEYLEKIDLPQKNVELTPYLVSASAAAGRSLPPSLRRAIERAGVLVKPEQCYLLDTLFVRSREGQQSHLDALASGPSGEFKDRRRLYSLVTNATNVTSESGRGTITVELHLGTRVPIGLVPAEKEGQPAKTVHETTQLRGVFDL
jgi:hypothetical protein